MVAETRIKENDQSLVIIYTAIRNSNEQAIRYIYVDALALDDTIHATSL